MIFYGKNKIVFFRNWHQWFAWYPVCISEDYYGIRKYAWFSYIMRRGQKKYQSRQYVWSYKAKDD